MISLFSGVGRIIHVSLLAAEADKAEADRKAKGEKEEDYRGESKFASHLKTSAGVSTFARNKTLKEQREYLPAFACREDLMRTLRENQGASIAFSHSSTIC